MKSLLVPGHPLGDRGFFHHLILPIIVVVAVGGIGVYTLHAIRAASSQYYNGLCSMQKTLSTTANSNDSCVYDAQALMDAVEHYQVAHGHSYRTAVSAGAGTTFKYGKDTNGTAVWYIAMTGKYNADTTTAAKRMSGNTSLTSGTSGTWQTLCNAAAAANMSTNKNDGANVLNFGTVKFPNGGTVPTIQRSTGNTKMYQIFQSACGTLTAIKTSTSGSGTGSGSNSSGGSSSSSAPYATALSSYVSLSQSYTASQMISGNWAQDANNTEEGGGSCPVGNTTYDAANNAVKLSTKGTAANPGSNTDCGHIRSASGISTNGTVIESKVWLPGSGSTLLDWASYWTDGVPTGSFSWPVTGELDAIETQYGVNYSSAHYGSNNTTMSTTPAGWGALPTPVNNSANNAVPGWNTVDIEFLANWSGANVYINGKLYASFPASAIPHYSAYVDWGISGPNAGDPNHASWPSGAAYEEVQYLKVFTK